MPEPNDCSDDELIHGADDVNARVCGAQREFLGFIAVVDRREQGRDSRARDMAHLQEAREAEQARSLSWWYFAENSRFGLSAELPAAEGAVVATALERLADRLPVMPGEDGGWSVDARRADALVALCSSRIAH
ncbi:MAG TPA: hypothetical protein VGL18_17325, partial [Actinomycetota bacterium]